MKRTLARLGSWLLALTLVFLAACTAIQVQSDLTLHEDGTGERTIRFLTAKDDHQDGYGSAYYYLKIHGEELETFLKEHYQEKVPGSEDWLQITVDDTDPVWEKTDLVFSFTSFEEYQQRFAALAYDEEQAAGWVDPTLVEGEDGIVTYTENQAALQAVFKSLQLDLMENPDVFDEASTKDGTPLNDGSADLQSLKDYGLEIMKPEFGEAMTITLGANEPTPVPNEDGLFTYEAKYSGEALPFDPNREAVKVLEFTFEDSLANTGSTAESDLVMGPGSSSETADYVEGIDGKAIQFDGQSYLASPNATYKYDELTLSFYFKMDQYTETDTGANMILVPAGLGALGAGVIDIEFLQTEDRSDTTFLAKMNSNDWMTQDNLFADDFMVDQYLGEWHHYAIIYDNDYDEFGNIEDSAVYIYIDGQLAARQRLTVAAGLPFGLGLFDDGSFGDPNGGFNVGGYFEADIVKRGVTGALDNLVIYDGALTEEQVSELLYQVEVENPWDPEAGSEPTEEPTVAPTEAPTTQAPTTPSETATPEEPSRQNNTVGIIVAIVAGVLVIAAAAVYVIKKKKS